MRAHLVELRSAVGRLADQHEPGSVEALEQRAEVGVGDRLDCLGGLADQAGEGRRAAPARHGVAVPLGGLSRPALSAAARHEAHVTQLLAMQTTIGLPGDAQELLYSPPLSHRHHETAARRELVQERLGHLGTSRRHDDRVVRGVLWPPERPVAMAHRDVLESQTREPLGRERRQLLVPLDRVDLAREPPEDRRRIARAGPDLEHPVSGSELGRRRHQRHDVGLRDRLAALDRKGRVRIGELLEAGREEGLTRYAPHRLQHGGNTYPSGGDLREDHVLARRRQIKHLDLPPTRRARFQASARGAGAGRGSDRRARSNRSAPRDPRPRRPAARSGPDAPRRPQTPPGRGP